MLKSEFAKFAAALKTYFPRENILPNSQAMELWFNQLEDIPYNVAEVVLNQWVATNKWSPSIADLREKAVEVVSRNTLEWSDGWEQVQKAIRYYGRYREEEALNSMDDLTRKVVKRLGFLELCNSENTSADRANFRTIYTTLAERQKKESQTPQKVLDVISSIKLINERPAGLIEGRQEK